MSVFGPLTTTLGTAATASAVATGAIDARQTRFVLVSTSNISGVGSLTTPQTVLVIDSEKMLVQSVPQSGVVEVIRGVDGTRAKPHAAGSIVYYAAKSAFSSFNPDGFIGLIASGGSGNPDGVLPDYVMPLGTQRVENGKVYVLCDFTSTVHSGVAVLISNDGNFTASPTTSAGNGAIGVVAEQTSTSDMWGWVQVYGASNVQDAAGTSGITSAYVPIVAGSVSTPATGLTALVNTTSTAQKYIYNMFITGDATTNVTSAASHTGVGLPVFLNYPYTFAVATDPGLS